MPVIKNGAVIGDPWSVVADDEDLPADRPVIVSSTRWRTQREALLARGLPLGIRLANTEAVASVAEDLGRVQLVALEFPTLADGRAFSQARLLRERYGFTGEVRATGAVLQDQMFFMKRCGFDCFVLAEGRNAEAAIASLNEFSVVYQPAADNLRPKYLGT